MSHARGRYRVDDVSVASLSDLVELLATKAAARRSRERSPRARRTQPSVSAAPWRRVAAAVHDMLRPALGRLRERSSFHAQFVARIPTADGNAIRITVDSHSTSTRSFTR
jgi:hypothetical protein